MLTTPLDAEEIAGLQEIIDEISISDITARVAALTPSQRNRARGYIEQWEIVRNEFVKLTGEVDLDDERERQTIRYRARRLCGYPGYPILTEEELALGEAGAAGANDGSRAVRVAIWT